MIEFLKLLNQKYGDTKFFQCIVRDYLKQKAGQYEQHRFYGKHSKAH